jgi:hypothetical protein
MDTDSDDEWNEWWKARVAALEQVLGTSEGGIWEADVPFDAGGTADLVRFRQHVAGVCYATAELAGREDQVPSTLGYYELVICTRKESNWAADLVSRLARYTTEAELNPGDTMDLSGAVPKRATIAGLLFLQYATLRIEGHDCGLLLCLGVTADELAACQAGRQAEVLEKLKAAGVYPFTDLDRPSVLTK